MLPLKKRGVRSSARRLALVACTVAMTGWATMEAQVVKAPRYQGGVDAPVQQLNLPALPPAISPHGVVVEDVVARVNDQIISRSDIERAEQQFEQDAAQNKMSATDQTIAHRDLLRDMIDEQLLISKAKELGLNADAEVVRRLDEIRKQNKMDSLDDLEKAARAQGVNYEDFKAQIRNQVLKQEVVRDEVGRKLQLSEADETKYYNEHINEFQQPEQVHLSEILIPLPETATPEQIAQAEAKANDVKSKIMAGGDFADLAKKYSGGPSAAQGGELGAWKRGGLAKVLEDAVFPLKVGDTTQPIRTRQGWLIMKVTAHDVAGPQPMSAVESQIQEAVYMQQMQPALRTYLTKLRGESYVELAPGFVDSGSSGNETKLVYSSYAPPPIKKKKEKSKSRFDRGNNARYQPVVAKKDVVSSPDTTGGRTITGPDAKPAIDPVTGLAVVTPTGKTRIASTVSANGKLKKEKKEKVRFGQAPRNSLPAGSADETTTAANTTPAAPAPGAAMASNGTGAEAPAPADLSENPLTPAEPVQKKTRFAQKAPEVKAKKVAAISAKQQEKIVATASPMGADEKADTQQQAAPLGLAGDTATKKKPKKAKTKKVKGQRHVAKPRLEDKAPTPKPQPTVVAPTANPNLAPTDLPATSAPNQNQSVPNSSVPRSVPNQPDTTLPPATQPPPGSPQQGQPVPGTNPPN